MAKVHTILYRLTATQEIWVRGHEVTPKNWVRYDGGRAEDLRKGEHGHAGTTNTWAQDYYQRARDYY